MAIQPTHVAHEHADAVDVLEVSHTQRLSWKRSAALVAGEGVDTGMVDVRVLPQTGERIECQSTRPTLVTLQQTHTQA